MIDPKPEDIGRLVIYNAGHPGAPDEEGKITAYNEHCVFVLYRGGLNAKATSRHDLRWTFPKASDNPPEPPPASAPEIAAEEGSESDD